MMMMMRLMDCGDFVDPTTSQVSSPSSPGPHATQRQVWLHLSL